VATMQVDVVTPERELFSGEASEVYARSLEGEIGILPGHQWALLALGIAPVRVRTADRGEVVIAVHEGFLEFRENHLTVLADAAELAEDIDPARAEVARRRAREHLSDEEDAATRAALARADLRLSLARR
jgi:F-type H+-transporting ATPase subunit epsilon